MTPAQRRYLKRFEHALRNAATVQQATERDVQLIMRSMAEVVEEGGRSDAELDGVLDYYLRRMVYEVLDKLMARDGRMGMAS